MTLSKRLKVATVINLVLPGAGLILARREWLGFALTMLFTLCAQIVVFAVLIVPDAVPHWIAAAAGAGMVLTWATGQWRLQQQLRQLQDPGVRSQIAMCYALADAAIREGRFEEALGALQVARTVDDEYVESYARLARLFALLGKIRQARKAWRQVEQLDQKQAFRREMVHSLEQLSTADNQ